MKADDIIEEGTEWAELGRELDVSTFERDDQYSDWHDSEPFDRMFKAVLWAKVEDESVTGIPSRLEEQPEVAKAFGFDLDDLPHGDTFARAWRERFEELQSTLETAATDIDEMASERGSPIGGHTGLTAEETDGSSKRTEQRLLREKTNEVLDEMANTVFPELDLPRPKKAIYDKDDLLELLTAMGMEGEAANGGADSHGDTLAEDKDVDLTDPFYEDGMRGETLLDCNSPTLYPRDHRHGEQSSEEDSEAYQALQHLPRSRFYGD